MKLSDVAKKIMEVDDDKYVSIGYGRYKLKGKEDDDNADVFTKTDSGQYVKSADQKSDDDKGGEEKPSGGSGMDAGDFERDFDDSEPEDKPHGGDTGTDADFQGEPPEGSREPDDVDDVDIKSIKQKVDDKGTHDAAQKSMEGIPRKSEKWNNIDGDWADLSTALENDDEEMLKQVLDDMEPESRKVFNQEFGADSQGSDEPEDDEEAAKAQAFKDMEDEKEESITINGQKYHPIKESKQRTFKEIYDRTFRSLK